MPATVPMHPAMATATHEILSETYEALEDEREQVPAELVGPEEVGERRRFESGGRVLGLRPVGRKAERA